ncbi:WAP four-disulfide core domain protein 1 isoform X1 [Ascaphus truei]|uniref:WAP four-disulfide core domain protein 1 isoform X1 n=1 Tax=Ascaphus truei TaxID=8439 RepID=UPI003F5A0D97
MTQKSNATSGICWGGLHHCPLLPPIKSSSAAAIPCLLPSYRCHPSAADLCCQDYEYQLYPHNTNYQKNDRCPPPPQSLPDRACEVPSCRSDSECERHKRCCYNGCIYACLESVQPPPVLDWLVQPKPRWLGGNGWLLDGPEEVLQAEACSTTEDGDEPLHCPTGYECHIINPGSPAEGIPNRGQCIKQRGNSDGRNLRHKYYKEYLGGHYNNVVVGKDKEPQKHLG